MRSRRIVLITLAVNVLLGLKSVNAVTDLAGGDLLCGTDVTPDPDGRTTSFVCNNNDALSGTFINAGMFRVEAGATVLVAGGVPLVVYASTIDVEGFMDGIGAGRAGGSAGTFANGGSGKNGRGDAFGYRGLTAQGAGGAGDGGIGGSGGSSTFNGPGGAGGFSTGTLNVAVPPVSATDLILASGGGGGGSCAAACGVTTGNGGAGGGGGGSVYLEASSMTIGAAGLIDVSGDPGIDAFNASGTTTTVDGPGAGGGGAGGMLVLRIGGRLGSAIGATINAAGGIGGSAFGTGGTCVVGVSSASHSGGGGGGGRVKLYYQMPPQSAVSISTAAGGGGFSDGSGCADGSNGVNGTQFFGITASSPTGLGASQVNISSIVWTWTVTPSFGNAAAASQRYRLFVYVSTAVAPPTPDSLRISSVTSAATTLNEVSLSPNTLYARILTAYTDYGDSQPTTPISTATLANAPAPASSAFTGLSDTGLTLNWTGGVPANPSYTAYEVDRSTDPTFLTAVSSVQVVALSTSPAGLTPNTTYYFRGRAINLNGIPTAFTPTLSTVTWASAPTAPFLSAVYITSVVFNWNTGANPPATKYLVQTSTDNFFSIAAATMTLGASAAFFNLTPGPSSQYYFRAAAVNSALVQSAFSTALSTAPGNLSNTAPATAPGTPQADRQYSYDGNAVFSWTPAQSPVGILDYNLLIGSTLGGSDFFSGNTASLTYSASGLTSGRTYYAMVRARSNAGIYSPFSNVSAGIPVFITSQVAPIAKPYSWPNPADPQNGPVNIGFSLGAPATVVLKIFTLQGNLAYQESRSYGSGNQVWPWNGRNGIGSVVEPGGYLCLLEKHYGNGTEVQKFKIAIKY